jgi:tetratricopeptide (TPR) repeat protein
MRAAYRAALQAWAEDDRVTARRMVGDLERPVAATTGTRAWRELVAAEGSVLSELAADRPEVLLAAVLLNRDLYQWYRARGEGALARHAWESAALLAIEAEDFDGWRPPAGFTEAVLLDLADHLVQSRQPDAARQLLEAAEKIAPSSPRPLLALGALAERSGRPEDAIRPLRRLVELEPGHLEARLRRSRR